LMDDDSPPGLLDLEEALAVATGALEPDVVANRGGHLSFGRIRHDLHAVSRPEVADFALVDGALVSRGAVQRAGFPREDLFMMHEDLEYTSRIVRSGGTVVVRPARPAAQHLGSAAPWRCYYQARNHLRIALDLRSVTWVVGWIDRMARLTVTDVLRGRWAHLGLRWRGACDALRNRMGRTVDPSTP
jgi:rhamnopyranosyl-N-acetylglucosaminyl-diphospho-decaprenol beta-1,3/1,4-galactofuranosyltransferase